MGLNRGGEWVAWWPGKTDLTPIFLTDLAHEGIDLSKAQRVDVRLYAGGPVLPVSSAPTRLDAPDTQVDTPAAPAEPRPSEVDGGP